MVETVFLLLHMRFVRSIPVTSITGCFGTFGGGFRHILGLFGIYRGFFWYKMGSFLVQSGRVFGKHHNVTVRDVILGRQRNLGDQALSCCVT